MRFCQRPYRRGFVEPATLLTLGVMAILLVATSLGVVVLNRQSTDNRSQARGSCSTFDNNPDACTSTPGCTFESTVYQCTDLHNNESACRNQSACSWQTAQYQSCDRFADQSACQAVSGCSWAGNSTSCHGLSASDCATKPGCSLASCSSADCTGGKPNCSWASSSCTGTTGACTGPSGANCSQFGSEDSCLTAYLEGCRWETTNCYGRPQSTCTSPCTWNPVCAGSYCQGSYDTGGTCSGQYQVSPAQCTGGTYTKPFDGLCQGDIEPEPEPEPVYSRCQGLECVQTTDPSIGPECTSDADCTLHPTPSPSPKSTPQPNRFTCTDAGACERAPDGEFLNLDQCSALCQPAPQPEPDPEPDPEPEPFTCTSKSGVCEYGIELCSQRGKTSVDGTCDNDGVCCSQTYPDPPPDNCTNGNSYCLQGDTANVRICKADQSGYDVIACSAGKTCPSGGVGCVTPTLYSRCQGLECVQTTDPNIGPECTSDAQCTLHPTPSPTPPAPPAPNRFTCTDAGACVQDINGEFTNLGQCNAVCEPPPCTGVCEYGTTDCASRGRVPANGTCPTDLSACCGGFITAQSQVCTPSQRTCIDDHTLEICNTAGTQITTTPCADNKTCVGGLCLSISMAKKCPKGLAYCIDDDKGIATCSNPGALTNKQTNEPYVYANYDRHDCPDGTLCVEERGKAACTPASLITTQPIFSSELITNTDLFGKEGESCTPGITEDFIGEVDYYISMTQMEKRICRMYCEGPYLGVGELQVDYCYATSIPDNVKPHCDEEGRVVKQIKILNMSLWDQVIESCQNGCFGGVCTQIQGSACLNEGVIAPSTNNEMTLQCRDGQWVNATNDTRITFSGCTDEQTRRMYSIFADYPELAKGPITVECYETYSPSLSKCTGVFCAILGLLTPDGIIITNSGSEEQNESVIIHELTHSYYRDSPQVSVSSSYNDVMGCQRKLDGTYAFEFESPAPYPPDQLNCAEALASISEHYATDCERSVGTYPLQTCWLATNEDSLWNGRYFCDEARSLDCNQILQERYCSHLTLSECQITLCNKGFESYCPS